MKTRQVVENRDRAEKQREKGLGVYDSEEILGDMKVVKDFAAFHNVHKTDLEVARAHLLLDYCDGTIFNAEQYNAYKAGLEAISKLFEAAESDVESYLIEAENKNKKKSVG